MIQNFRGKNAKDIETAQETIILNAELSNISSKAKPKASLNVTGQQLNEDNFDSFIEKRNKEFK